MPQNDTDNEGDAAPGRERGCLWCLVEPVPFAGHFCSSNCWVAYYTWWQALLAHGSEAAGMIVIQPDEEVPVEVRTQPWYRAAVVKDQGGEFL